LPEIAFFLYDNMTALDAVGPPVVREPPPETDRR
jgi:hypothetical protein